MACAVQTTFYCSMFEQPHLCFCKLYPTPRGSSGIPDSDGPAYKNGCRIALVHCPCRQKSRGFSLFLRVLIIVAELSIGGLESADQYVYLLSIHKFYDVGTSYLVFYILIFYIVIPNKIKITVCTSIVISMMFIISVHSTGIATSSDLFTTSIYFLITNALGYAIVLNANTSKREEYHHTIQVKKRNRKPGMRSFWRKRRTRQRGAFLR